MKKVVINDCFGGFSLSHKGIMRYAEIKGFKLYPWVDDICRQISPEKSFDESMIVHYSKVPVKSQSEWDAIKRERQDVVYFSCRDIDRSDPALIQVIRELKSTANGQCAKLKIVSIPDDVDYEIEEYDGNEHIAEKHRTWR